MIYFFDIVKYYPNNYLIRLALSFAIFGLMILLLINLSSSYNFGLIFTLSTIAFYFIFLNFFIEKFKKIGELKIDNEKIIKENTIIAIKDIKNIIITGESFVTIHYSKHRVYLLKIKTKNNETFFFKVKTHGINDKGRKSNLFDVLNKKNLSYHLKIR